MCRSLCLLGEREVNGWCHEGVPCMWHVLSTFAPFLSSPATRTIVGPQGLLLSLRGTTKSGCYGRSHHLYSLVLIFLFFSFFSGFSFLSSNAVRSGVDRRSGRGTRRLCTAPAGKTDTAQRSIFYMLSALSLLPLTLAVRRRQWDGPVRRNE